VTLEAFLEKLEESGRKDSLEAAELFRLEQLAFSVGQASPYQTLALFTVASVLERIAVKVDGSASGEIAPLDLRAAFQAIKNALAATDYAQGEAPLLRLIEMVAPRSIIH